MGLEKVFIYSRNDELDIYNNINANIMFMHY